MPDAGPAKYQLAWMALKERMKQLLAEYGKLAIVVYLVLFVAVIIGFVVAVQAGFEVEGAAEGVTLIGGAWLAAKVTQPFRIMATLAITPILAAVIKRLRGPAKVEGPTDPT